MQIMIAGDIHGDFEGLGGMLPIAALAGCRQMIQIGDFGWESGDHFLAAELRELDRRLLEHRLTLYWLDGNHDDPSVVVHPSVPARDGVGVCHERLAGSGYYEQIRFLPRGSRWQWDGLRFCALGGADSTIERFMGVPDTAIDPRILPSAADVERSVRGGRADVLLTHDCTVTDLVALTQLFDVTRDHPAAQPQSQPHRRGCRCGRAHRSLPRPLSSAPELRRDPTLRNDTDDRPGRPHRAGRGLDDPRYDQGAAIRLRTVRLVTRADAVAQRRREPEAAERGGFGLRCPFSGAEAPAEERGTDHHGCGGAVGPRHSKIGRRWDAQRTLERCSRHLPLSSLANSASTRRFSAY
jgi:hypothetical protein